MSAIAATPTAVRIEPAYADPAAVLSAIRAIDEWWPLARYGASPEEIVAIGGNPATATYVPPWFRRDVALAGVELVDGAGLVLHNPAFVEGAHLVFGDDAVVEPSTVYVNVMLPSVAPFVPHVDVPAFRGFTRADHPIWLLQMMMHSGLFDRWRVRLATSVSWFYDGPGGDFHYWPAGPDAPSDVVRSPYGNVAVLADNERTYHGVAPVGADAAFVQGLTRDSTLHRIDGGWEARTAGVPVVTAADEDVRITVSWKAEVYEDAEERSRALDHADDLTLDHVVTTMVADLRARGIDVAAPDDPHHGSDWVQAVSAAYGKQPPRVPR